MFTQSNCILHMWPTPIPVHQPHGGMTLQQLRILHESRGEHQLLMLSRLVWEMSAVQMAEGLFIARGTAVTCPCSATRDISYINMAGSCRCCGWLARWQDRCQATVQAFHYSMQVEVNPTDWGEKTPFILQQLLQIYLLLAEMFFFHFGLDHLLFHLCLILVKMYSSWCKKKYPRTISSTQTFTCHCAKWSLDILAVWGCKLLVLPEEQVQGGAGEELNKEKRSEEKTLNQLNYL